MSLLGMFQINVYVKWKRVYKNGHRIYKSPDILLFPCNATVHKQVKG